ncbi:hypothetical protein T484DRAFT_1757268, partial [Baffinella frigidus]
MSSESHGLKSIKEEDMVSRPHRSIHSSMFRKKATQIFNMYGAGEDMKSNAHLPLHKRVTQPHNDQSTSPRSRSSGSGYSASESMGDVDVKYKAIVARKKKEAMHTKEDMHHTYQAKDEEANKIAVHRAPRTQGSQTTMVPQSDHDLYAEFLEYKKMHQQHKQRVVGDVEYSAQASADAGKRLIKAKQAYEVMYPHGSRGCLDVDTEKERRQRRRQIEIDATIAEYAAWDIAK